MTKAQARKIYLAKRKALSQGERDMLNQHIYHNFFINPALSFVRTLHIFLSMERTLEPDTWGLIDRLRREMPFIRLVIPRIAENGELDHVYFEGLHQLKQSAFGIMEPVQGIPAEIAKIDFVLVPLLAVDRNGNRVGYGKGHYDRFLKECRADCTKAGISFFPPTEIFTDVEPHDVPLDLCFTPDGAIAFR